LLASTRLYMHPHNSYLHELLISSWFEVACVRRHLNKLYTYICVSQYQYITETIYLALV